MNDVCVGGSFIAKWVEPRRVPLIEKIYRLYTTTTFKGERDVCRRKLRKFGFCFPHYTGNVAHAWDIMEFLHPDCEDIVIENAHCVGECGIKGHKK